MGFFPLPLLLLRDTTRICSDSQHLALPESPVTLTSVLHRQRNGTLWVPRRYFISPIHLLQCNAATVCGSLHRNQRLPRQCGCGLRPIAFESSLARMREVSVSSLTPSHSSSLFRVSRARAPSLTPSHRHRLCFESRTLAFAFEPSHRHRVSRARQVIESSLARLRVKSLNRVSRAMILASTACFDSMSPCKRC